MASQIAPDPNRRMLIDGIGGEAKIEQLVKIIIDRIYADARINTFFAGIDATKMKERLKLFLIQLTGGAKKYEIVIWKKKEKVHSRIISCFLLVIRVRIWEMHIRTLKSMMYITTSSWIISAKVSSKWLLSQQCIMSSAGFLRVSEFRLSRLNFPFTIDSAVNLP